VGGWINVYQQARGIATLVDFYLTVCVPSGGMVQFASFSRCTLRVPPLTHHLN